MKKRKHFQAKRTKPNEDNLKNEEELKNEDNLNFFILKVNLKNEDDLQRHLLIVKLKPILNYY